MDLRFHGARRAIGLVLQMVEAVRIEGNIFICKVRAMELPDRSVQLRRFTLLLRI